MDEQIKRRGAMLFVFGFGAVFLIALLSLVVTGHGSRPLIENIYRSVGLFTGNSSWAFDSAIQPAPPFVFKLLAVIAPFVSALGLVELVTGRAWSDWLRLKAVIALALGVKEPMAIFGLSTSSLVFARSLIVENCGKLPVIFDPAPSLPLLDLCNVESIPVFKLLLEQNGYFKSRPTIFSIQSFVLHRAKTYVSFFVNPDEQVSLVKALDGWSQYRLSIRRGNARNRPEAERKSAWLLMSQRGLRQRLDSYQKFTQQMLHLQFFDFNSLAARQLLHKHPFDMWADILGQSQIHIAIYGFGSLGRAIAKEAARYYVTRASIVGTDRKLRLTIIDEEPCAAKAAFLAEEPEIENILRIEICNASLQPGGLTCDQIRCIIPEHVTAHIITLNEPEWVVAQALSLRRWLLEPPSELDQIWFNAHRNAPIFVPISDWRGLGSLIRSGVDWPSGAPRSPEIPDGIFGFGNLEEVLSCVSILCGDRISGAKVLHEYYEKHLMSLDPSRPAVTPWSDLAPNIRQSNMLAFDHSWIKARATGRRVIPLPKDQSRYFPSFESDEKVFLSQLEHQRYLAERIADGWRKANIRCDPIRVHPDLCDWEELTLNEQAIDNNLIEAMPAALFAVKKRFENAHFVGIVGHRLPDARDRNLDKATYPILQEAALRHSLRNALSEMLRRYPGTVLLSALATGADTWAVEEAKKLSIPWIVVLPLPYELYSDDFSKAAMGDVARPGKIGWQETFRALVAEAEYYFELPMKAGRCSEMGRGTGEQTISNAVGSARDNQYAMAGRYIVERSHTLLAVWDGKAARGSGGTHELVAFRAKLALQQQATSAPTASNFFSPVPMTQPEVYLPDGTRFIEWRDNL